MNFPFFICPDKKKVKYFLSDLSFPDTLHNFQKKNPMASQASPELQSASAWGAECAPAAEHISRHAA